MSIRVEGSRFFVTFFLFFVPTFFQVARRDCTLLEIFLSRGIKLIAHTMSAASSDASAPSAQARKNLEKAEKMVVGYAKKFPRVELAAPPQIKQLQNKGLAILVDVRKDAERAVSVIPGSLSQAEFEALSQEELEGKTVIPYCTMGYRSGQYATQLLDIKEGKKAAKGKAAGALRSKLQGVQGVLNGTGVVLWTHDSTVAPLVDPQSQAPAKAVHVFGSTWDLAADGYETHTFASSFWGNVKSKIGALFAVSATVLLASLVALKFRGR